jgi:hypothetical protein
MWKRRGIDKTAAECSSQARSIARRAVWAADGARPQQMLAPYKQEVARSSRAPPILPVSSGRSEPCAATSPLRPSSPLGARRQKSEASNQPAPDSAQCSAGNTLFSFASMRGGGLRGDRVGYEQ